ncbi:hypothetical protein T484DRAFT_1817728 [Baffinella frigidus]|nr:hypothetical protein T484DRAFT_1817728 [Cryptophyta sp. CCMP2293]
MLLRLAVALSYSQAIGRELAAVVANYSIQVLNRGGVGIEKAQQLPTRIWPHRFFDLGFPPLLTIKIQRPTPERNMTASRGGRQRALLNSVAGAGDGGGGLLGVGVDNLITPGGS